MRCSRGGGGAGEGNNKNNPPKGPGYGWDEATVRSYDEAVEVKWNGEVIAQQKGSETKSLAC